MIGGMVPFSTKGGENMAKPVGELLQDYVDMKLGCGGCMLGVIGVGAFVWAFMEFAKSMIEIYSGVNWLMWFAVALFIVTAVIAVGFCISTIKHHGQIGGGVMLFDTLHPSYSAVIM